MAENSTVTDLLTVGGGFTAEQVDALRRCFEVYEDRVVLNETSTAKFDAAFGDLTSADANDTLVADANGVYQVNPVA